MLSKGLSFTFGSPCACIVEKYYTSLCLSLPPLKGWSSSYKRVQAEREGKHVEKREKESKLTWVCQTLAGTHLKTNQNQISLRLACPYIPTAACTRPSLIAATRAA